MLKFIFAIITLFTCTAVGFLKSFKLRSRLRSLMEFKNALGIFKSSIRFTYTDMENAFYETDKLSDTSGVFKLAAQSIKTMGASNAWQYAINKSAASLCLNKEDIHTLSLLSTKLGMTDECEQIKTIDYVLNMLDIHISSARFDAEKYCRLYSSGGILTGAFLCLMLV